jgi:hypothetical protein
MSKTGSYDRELGAAYPFSLEKDRSTRPLWSSGHCKQKIISWRSKLISKKSDPRTQATSSEKKRVDIMAAAAKNPALEPTIKYAVGRLKSLGIDIHAAADLGTLNKAMTEAKLPMTQRLALKTALAHIGVLA